MAAAEPSFRISIDSISEGFNEFSPLLENAPSITYKGKAKVEISANYSLQTPSKYLDFLDAHFLQILFRYNLIRLLM